MSEQGYIRVVNFSDSFSICVTSEQSFRGAQKDPSARWLELTFDALDKEAVFFRALKAFDPAAFVGGRISTDDHKCGKWENLCKESNRSIEQATANLPMLRRLKEEYNDASYSAEEIAGFREECLKVRVQTDDPGAVASLETLLLACDEALKEGSGLYFASN